MKSRDGLCRWWMFNLAAVVSAAPPEYTSIGCTWVFIGKDNDRTDRLRLPSAWFDARQSCWERSGQLISVETPEQMECLQTYILEQGYEIGSTFSTSGHSFLSAYPYKWDALAKAVDYTKWHGDDPVPSTFLSLQLVDSELYMVPSDGFDDYYICEYVPPHWLSRNETVLVISVIIFLVILGLALVLAKAIGLLRIKAPSDIEKQHFIT